MLIVCPNLAVDRTLKVRTLRRGSEHRARGVSAQAGGKGANVARVAHALGADPLLVGFAGGVTGATVRDGLVGEGIRVELVAIEGETRFTVALVEDDGTTTLVNEPGPTVSAEDCACLVETAVAAARPDEIVLLTGSLPPGAPESLFAQLLDAFEGRRVVVDATGASLAASLAARPYLVKPNLAEARAHGADALTVARALVAAGARHALVSAGADEAVLSDGSETIRLVPPRVEAVNPTGSGDALAAGILTGLESGRLLQEAVRLGIAAAADNVTSDAAGRIDRDRVQLLEARVEIRGPDS